VNFDLSSFLLGLIAGWVIEWLVDYFYYRRRGHSDEELAALQAQLDRANSEVGGLRLALNNAETERDDWHARHDLLEADIAGRQVLQDRLDDCLSRFADLENANTKMKADHEAALLAATAAAVVTAHESDDRALEIDIVGDDLTLIKGIGPRFSEKLNLYGINSFAELADATDARLDTAIEPQPWMDLDYDSWRAQARTFAEVPPQRISGDDLQRLEGIGPKYEQRLRGAGIITYSDLANSNSEQLAVIIAASPWHKVDYGSWIAQARLADAGDEDGLAALQDKLNRREGGSLLLIHGLGDSYYLALSSAGVDSYADLAAMQPGEVDAILAAAGLRKADTAAWIEEAKLRAAGKRVARVKRAYKAPVMASCPQDLEQIFGVGVIYERRLYAAGVGSFWEVAQLSDDTLKDILEVEAFQDVDPQEIRRSAMELAVESATVNRVWDGTPPDDFEPLEGIGITFERRLYDAGICTYRALAAATIDELERICRPPNFQKPKFAKWIDQAKLLAAREGADQ
jgi:predicted flap endonuclease-1-like 5' DNA nuclease